MEGGEGVGSASSERERGSDLDRTMFQSNTFLVQLVSVISLATGRAGLGGTSIVVMENVVLCLTRSSLGGQQPLNTLQCPRAWQRTRIPGPLRIGLEEKEVAEATGWFLGLIFLLRVMLGFPSVS